MCVCGCVVTVCAAVHMMHLQHYKKIKKRKNLDLSRIKVSIYGGKKT